MKQISRTQRVNPQGKAASLEEKLRSQTRLLDADKKLLAENLGRICKELNEDKPLNFVKTLIEKSGLQSLQQKRKRFIRLPGEEETSVGEKGAYGSSGDTFATLASTAAELLSANNNEDIKGRTKEATFRKLLKGTSFLPANKPLTLAGRRTKDILDEYAERLSERITKETRLTELWKILEHTPISIRRSSDLPKRKEKPKDYQYGKAQQLPDELVKYLYGDSVQWANFRIGGLKNVFPAPTIRIGKIIATTEMQVFNIPKEVRPYFHPSKEIDDHLSEQAQDWLRSSGYYDRSGGESELVHQIAYVFLVVPIIKGKPTLRLWVDDYTKFCSDYGWLDRIEDLELTQTGNCETEVEGCIHYLWERPQDAEAKEYEHDNYPAKIIDADDAVIYMEINGWTEDDLVLEILTGANDSITFHSHLWESTSAGPFSSDSVGGALIGNLEDELENRVDKKLIRQAQLLAEAGMAFYEAVFDNCQETLRKITED